MQRSFLERTGIGGGPTERTNFGRFPRAIGIGLIRLYQAGTKWKPATCRYTPSCSQYTLEAIDKYGLLKGIWMGTKRICRCHPGRLGGHDPVP